MSSISFINRSLKLISSLSYSSYIHASRGFKIISYGGWIIITASIILYFPLERAWDSDTLNNDNLITGTSTGGGGGVVGSTTSSSSSNGVPSILSGGQ